MPQAIRRLLTRPEYFRLEREFAGPDFHRGEQCTLSRHTFQYRRALDPRLALTRKNALFAGHDRGAAGWAMVASLLETCKLNRVDPLAWTTDVLTKPLAGIPHRRADALGLHLKTRVNHRQRGVARPLTFGRSDKWIVCLTAGTVVPANQEKS